MKAASQPTWLDFTERVLPLSPPAAIKHISNSLFFFSPQILLCQATDNRRREAVLGEERTNFMSLRGRGDIPEPFHPKCSPKGPLIVPCPASSYKVRLQLLAAKNPGHFGGTDQVPVCQGHALRAPCSPKGGFLSEAGVPPPTAPRTIAHRKQMMPAAPYFTS